MNGFLATALIWMLAATPALAAEEKTTFVEAFKTGTVTLGLRYRFEVVDEDRFDERAEASTLRTTLAFRTAAWKGWKLFLEAEDVTAIFDDDGYANAGAGDLNNGVTGVPVVADPDATEINQSYLEWRDERWKVVFGRQEINIGDQRFVGAVGWRQNHQSFDAVRIGVDASDRVRVDYTFAAAVNRIFGDDLQMSSHFLDIPIAFGSSARLGVYGFLLDYDAAQFQALSTLTFGVAWKDKRSIGDRFTLRYEVELASQQDAGDNPLDIDTEYLSLTVGGDVGPIAIDVTWEALGDAGTGDRAFQTPLATLHKWNGWADKFLQTPIAGLEDLSLRIGGNAGDHVRWSVRFHDFGSDRGGFDYGSELDGEVVYTAPWKQVFALKLAAYDADAFATDTEKLMLWTSYSF